MRPRLVVVGLADPAVLAVAGHRVQAGCMTRAQSSDKADGGAVTGITRGRFLPALGVFAGGFAYALLQTGAFGAYDSAARAAITGTVAGITALLLFALTKRRTSV